MMCEGGCGQPGNCECSPREPEEPTEQTCIQCKGLILIPGRSYGIHPDAVCKCPHAHPNVRHKLDAEIQGLKLQNVLLQQDYDALNAANLDLQDDIDDLLAGIQTWKLAKLGHGDSWDSIDEMLIRWVEAKHTLP